MDARPRNVDGSKRSAGLFAAFRGCGGRAAVATGDEDIAATKTNRRSQSGATAGDAES